MNARPGSARGALAKNSIVGAVAGVSTMVGGFLSSVLVARLLGVEGTGVVSFATWLVTVGVILIDLGIPGALARYCPELRARGAEREINGLVGFLVRPYLVAVLAVSAGFVLLGFFVSAQTGSAWQAGVAFWLMVAGSCFVQGLGAFFNGYLRGMQRFGDLARIAIASAMLQVGATVAGALLFGALGAIAGGIAVSIIPAFFLVTIATRSGSLAPELKRRVTRFAWEAWLGYLLAAFAWSRMEIFFLQQSWGSYAVGLFTVSLTLANLATQVPLMLTMGLLPFMSEHATASPEKTVDAYSTAMRILAFLIFPTCVGGAAIAPALLPAIYGSDFAAAVPTAVVLVAGSASSAAASVGVTYLLAREKTRFVYLSGAASAAVLIIAGLTVVPAYGPLAAAIARVSIQLAVSAATLWYIARHLGTPAPMGALLRLLSAAVLCSAVAFFCIRFVPGVTGIAVAIASAALVYPVCVRLFRALPASDVQRLVGMLSVLPAALRPPLAFALRMLAP